MIPTGAFFAEHATVAEQKLNVLNGVIDFIDGTLNEDGSVTAVLSLVVLLQSEAGVAEEADVVVRAYAVGGEAIFQINLTGWRMEASDNNGFVFVPLQMALPAFGKYAFVAQVGEADDAHAITVMLEVRNPA